ncbi:hypothetical protein BS17DRAFT_775820 [Gyrodon lividus]|nr:hypothetical protein BS17DRAFT_775820 [Gyrodon lividus]
MDLSKDLHDWNNRLNDNERHLISHAPALGGIVNENLMEHFSDNPGCRGSLFLWLPNHDGELRDVLSPRCLLTRTSRILPVTNTSSALWKSFLASSVRLTGSLISARDLVSALLPWQPLRVSPSLAPKSVASCLASNELINRDEEMQCSPSLRRFWVLSDGQPSGTWPYPPRVRRSHSFRTWWYPQIPAVLVALRQLCCETNRTRALQSQSG